MANPENKQIPYESTQKDIRDAIESVATAIGGIAIPSADHVSYDNSGSGLSATDVQDAIDELSSEKVDKEVGKGLSTNDYTDAEKTKLAGIEANAEVNVQSDWNEADNTKDDYIKNKPSSEVKTATDTFTTVNGGLLEECNIELEPVQDLHGYDSPWVGGAGKNKLPLVLADIKSANQSGTWSGNVYTWFNSTFEILQDSDGNVTGVKVGGTNSGANCQLNIPVGNLDGDYYFCGCANDGAENTYNVLMWDRTTSARVKKWDGTTNSDTATDLATPHECKMVSGHTIEYRIRVMSGVAVNNVIYLPMIVSKTETDFTFESYSNICPISGHTEVDLDVKDGDNVTQHTYQVQIGSTVYGGTVDLVSGNLDSAFGVVDLGSLDWTYESSFPRFRSEQIADMKSTVLFNSNDLICEALKASNAPISGTVLDNTICGYTDHRLYVKCYTYTDKTTFITAMAGIKCVYRKETPSAISTTPQQIEALVGQNNLSTPLDGQSIDSVEYREVFAFDDVEKVVSLRVPISMLGTDESGRTTASQAYASGDYFYKDGYMCKALTSISAGATLTLNTNYSQGTLADILKAIENA